MFDKKVDWKEIRKSKISDYIMLTYIISLLLICLLVVEFMTFQGKETVLYGLLFIIIFYLIIILITSHFYKNLKNNYVLLLLCVLAITLIIAFKIIFNEVTSESCHMIKIILFIPIIMAAVSYGRLIALSAAIYSSLCIVVFNFLLRDFSTLNMDIILIIMFFWIAWLNGGFSDLNKSIQKHLEKLIKNEKNLCLELEESINKKITLARKLAIANRNLNESQELFRLNFEESQVGMTITDINNNIIKVNPSFCKMLGYTEKKLLSMKFTDFIDSTVNNQKQDVYNKLLQDEIDTAHYEEKYISKEGKDVWVRKNISLVKDQEKNPLYFLNQLENITEKKKVEREIEIQKEKLEYTRIKNNFFAKLSHELRTPLNLIFTALNILDIAQKKHIKQEGKEKVDKYTKLIKQNGCRLLRLVNNVIDLTRIDSNSFTLNLGNYDIVNIVKEIVLSTKEYTIDKKRYLEFNPELEKKVIACDPFNIERILLNLISNAVKFTDEGDKIIVSVAEKDNKILLTVKDTGVGIKKEKIDLIFQQFRQVDESYSRKSEGSGIGLSIVKSLVKLHEGRIWVESEYGKGTEFFIELPIKTVKKESKPKRELPNELIDKIDVEFSDIYYNLRTETSPKA